MYKDTLLFILNQTITYIILFNKYFKYFLQIHRFYPIIITSITTRNGYFINLLLYGDV